MKKEYNFKDIENNEFVEVEDERNLKDKLIEFRKIRSKEKGIPAYYVFTNDELDKILQLLPKTLGELRASKILTDVKVNSHGKEMVDIINSII